MAKVTLAELVAEVTDQITAARSRIETLKRERDALDSAPLPTADLIARVSECVDSRVVEFDSNIEQAVERVLHRPGLDLRSMPGGFPILERIGGDGRIDAKLVEALLGKAIRDRVAAVINRMDYTPGPPARERPAARERLTREIETAETELAEILANARAAGLNLST